jgi:ABC-type transport system involved in cytochrome c biogenesis ATPase subunit
MDITMIGLQNAGKTSLLRVLAVSLCRSGTIPVQRHGVISCRQHPSNRFA